MTSKTKHAQNHLLQQLRTYIERNYDGYNFYFISILHFAFAYFMYWTLTIEPASDINNKIEFECQLDWIIEKKLGYGMDLRAHISFSFLLPSFLLLLLLAGWLVPNTVDGWFAYHSIDLHRLILHLARERKIQLHYAFGSHTHSIHNCRASAI